MVKKQSPSARYLKRHGRIPIPDGRIPTYIAVIFCFVFTVLYFFLYTMYVSRSITIVDMGILVIAAFVTDIIFCSWLREPERFLRALLERFFRPIALILALALRLFGLYAGLILWCVRLVFCIGVLIWFDISPLQLAINLIPGFGQLTDLGINIVLIYFGLFAGKIMLSHGIKEMAANLIDISKIKTKFP
jgi:hypothetical protein